MGERDSRYSDGLGDDYNCVQRVGIKYIQHPSPIDGQLDGRDHATSHTDPMILLIYTGGRTPISALSTSIY